MSGGYSLLQLKCVIIHHFIAAHSEFITRRGHMPHTSLLVCDTSAVKRGNWICNVPRVFRSLHTGCCVHICICTINCLLLWFLQPGQTVCHSLEIIYQKPMWHKDSALSPPGTDRVKIFVACTRLFLYYEWMLSWGSSVQKLQMCFLHFCCHFGLDWAIVDLLEFSLSYARW